MMTFRLWLQEKYYQHKEECEGWHSIPAKSLKEYFTMYKWWLKREYRYQMRNKTRKITLDYYSK